MLKDFNYYGKIVQGKRDYQLAGQFVILNNKVRVDFCEKARLGQNTESNLCFKRSTLFT